MSKRPCAIKLEDPGLETAALRFVPLDASHRDLILTSGIEDAVWRWMPALKGGTSFEQYFDFMLKAHEANIYTTFVLYSKETDQFLGIAGYTDTNRQHRRTRIAIAWFAPDLFKPHFFQSAQLALMKRALDWGAKRIEWSINPENKFMMEQLEAIKPVFEARLRNYERLAGGRWADKMVYSMTRPEAADRIKDLEFSLESNPAPSY
ncbi:MAG: GNAT family protein [Henriciella sp.]